MNYNEFKEAVLSKLKNIYGEDYTVSIVQVNKNNGVVLDGINISKEGHNCTPTIYLNKYYDLYDRDLFSFEEIVNAINDAYIKAEVEAVDFSFFNDFAQVNSKIFATLINRKENESLLKYVPYVPYKDLAIVFKALISDSTIGKGTVLIKTSHLERWNVNVNDLMDAAKKNKLEGRTPIVTSMTDFMKSLKVTPDTDMSDMPFEMEGPQMFILHTEDKFQGASVILDNDFMKKFVDYIGSPLMILPSSIHEVIAVPINDLRDNHFEEFDAMVKAVNTESVDTEDILSDHVYVYDNKTMQLLMPNEYMAMQAEGIKNNTQKM